MFEIDVRLITLFVFILQCIREFVLQKHRYFVVQSSIEHGEDCIVGRVVKGWFVHSRDRQSGCARERKSQAVDREINVYLTNLFRIPELWAKPTDHNEVSADESDSPDEMLINETVF